MKLLFFLFLGIGFLLQPADSFAKENECVSCHQKISGPKYVGHNFADWQKSVHAAKGIHCSACHGGNPETQDPVQAHQGVLSSRDKNSNVHFQKIPQTCGQCHQTEFQEFKKSVHYSRLLDTGKGPNCLTCHGAMATTILAYSDMEKTCSLCHGKPMAAGKALSLLHSVKQSLQIYVKRKDAPKKEEFVKRYDAIQKKWHSFDVNAVVEEAQALMKEIK